MEALSLPDCKTLLSDSSASLTQEKFEKILDSMNLHIQSSTVQVDAEAVAEIVDALKKPIKCLFNQVGTLDKELKELQKKYQELEKLRLALLVGEIASHLERKLLEHILNGTSVSLEYATFSKLEKALEGQSGRRRTGMQLTEEEKRIAGENWDRLDKELQLDANFYQSIGHLKHHRNLKAHPKLKRSKMYSCLEQLEEEDKPKVKKVIEIIEKMDQKTGPSQ